jgi:hypothetical protein
MNNKLILFLLSSLFISTAAFSANPVGKYLSKLDIFEDIDGRNAEVYQDVVLKLNPFQDFNSEYPIICETDIPEGFVKKSEARKIFKKLKSHPIYTENELTFEEFMNDYFYITNEDGSEKFSDFPCEIQASPELNKLYLCLDGDYRYVSEFEEYEPDALSCNECPELCDKNCRKQKTIVKERIIRTRYGYYTVLDEKNKREHSFGANNIYKEFRNTLLSRTTIEDADDYIDKKNYINITIKDRVPPSIENGLPKLGEKDSDYTCTSCDHYKTENFDIKDDIEPVVYAKFSFGRFDECPKEDEKLIDKENWNKEEKIVKIDHRNENNTSKKNFFNDVVRFTEPFDGYIRYSIFAKEKNPKGEGNVNPSVAKIEYKQPDIGYGYPEAGDLGNTMDTAQDWPEKNDLPDYNKNGYNTGLIRVCDNDRPNIIIRITNTQTNEQMFFPPCFGNNDIEISNSSKYKAISGKFQTNQDDYNFFVDKLDDAYNHKEIVKNKDSKPYFTIYSINDSNLKKTANGSLADRLLLNADPKFIKENVRVEDYYFSDNDTDGINIINDNKSNFKNGSLGKSLGTFSKMAVLFENSGNFQFKTGVEYKLDVWTDDNVKWTNISSEKNGEYLAETKILDRAKVYETGIKSGFIKLDFHNENLNKEINIDPKKSINGNILFTLEDTINHNHNIKTVEELEANGFPSVTVYAEDFSGLTRELKLFLRVNDRKLHLKTLD